MAKRVLLSLILGLTSVLVVAAPVAAGDTRCGTPFPEDPNEPPVPEVLTGTYDNVIVPRMTFCVLEGATVRGNMRVKQGATAILVEATVRGNVTGHRDAGVFFELATVRGNVRTKTDAGTQAFGSTINGNFTCDGCYFEDIFDTTVRGNVTVRSAELGDFMCRNTFGGNVHISDSRTSDDPAGPVYTFELIDNRVAGSVTITGNAGPLIVHDNRIRGNLQVASNDLRFVPDYPAEEGCFPGTVYDGNEILGNTVRGSVQVTKNLGEVEIAANAIKGNLHCSDNSPPPVGGGNSAAKKQGQCRNL